MIHQLRIYDIFQTNKDAFHARFRDHAARIMTRYGFDIVAMWEAKRPERTEFVYLPPKQTFRGDYRRRLCANPRHPAEWRAGPGPVIRSRHGSDGATLAIPKSVIRIMNLTQELTPKSHSLRVTCTSS
jgi:hypothetical protein